MSEHMDMIRGVITILNRDTSEIVINESFGLTEEEQARGRYMPGEGIIGQVVKTGMHRVVPRIDEEPLFLDRTGSRNRIKTDHICFACVPIKAGNEVIGTLSADRPVFTGEDLQHQQEEVHIEELVNMLSIIASMISQAVRIKQLAQEEVRGEFQGGTRKSKTPLFSYNGDAPDQDYEQYNESHRPARADIQVCPYSSNCQQPTIFLRPVFPVLDPELFYPESHDALGEAELHCCLCHIAFGAFQGFDYHFVFDGIESLLQ